MPVKILIFIFLSSFSVQIHAALFGASSYEECMSDDKVGRTNAEIQLLRNKCETKFPRLKRLGDGGDANIICTGGDNENLELRFAKSTVFSGKKFKNKSPIKYRSNKALNFDLNELITYKEKYLLINAELNALNGELNLVLRETVNGSVLDTFKFSCNET